MTDYSHTSLTSSMGGLVLTSNPGVNHDASNGWVPNSHVLNTTTGVAWVCISAANGAAVWTPVGAGSNALLGVLLSANMNVTTDQAFTMLVSSTAKYRINKITATNASTSLTTAVGGVYPAASKGGTATVANTQVYSALSAATKAVDLTLANQDTLAAATISYLSLTTPQGGAATADLYLYGHILFQ